MIIELAKGFSFVSSFFNIFHKETFDVFKEKQVPIYYTEHNLKIISSNNRANVKIIFPYVFKIENV